MKKEQILAPLGLGLGIIIFIFSLYFSSARFVDSPSIILPSEYTIENDVFQIENKFIYADIEITTENFKAVISKLFRPNSYDFTINNTIFAINSEKNIISNISLTPTEITINRDDIEIFATNELITFTQNSNEHTVSRKLYSNDELIGIPTYEDLLFDEFIASEVELLTLNFEDVLKITSNDSETTKIHVISLATGLLVRYEIYENNALKREVLLENLVIYN